VTHICSCPSDRSACDGGETCRCACHDAPEANPFIIDAFGGMGGWAEGLRRLGLAEVGIELDADACATRAAAGHRTIRADVSTMPLAHLAGRVEGLILSPPCPDWSRAGKGARMAGESGHLVLEVLRWAVEVRPAWIACEQVDTVLPVWRAFGLALERLGYRWWAGLVDAADYGVPQNRVRALLLCSASGQPHRPPRTHARRPEEDLEGRRLLPWVTMAEALGWGRTDRPTTTVMTPRGHGCETAALDGGSDARRGYREAMARGDWVLRTGANSMVTGREPHDVRRYERTLDRPAPTVDGKAGSAWVLDRRCGPSARTVPRSGGCPSPTVTAASGAKAAWVWRRPATTVSAESRIFRPGHHPGRSEGAIRITLAEALVLQDFAPGYPVAGRTKESRFRQVGNAVPPGLGAAVVAHVRGLGTTRPPAVEVEGWRELVPQWLAEPASPPRPAPPDQLKLI
jgi:DNA (cytosine-5)-methyltransferase 1